MNPDTKRRRSLSKTQLSLETKRSDLQAKRNATWGERIFNINFLILTWIIMIMKPKKAFMVSQNPNVEFDGSRVSVSQMQTPLESLQYEEVHTGVLISDGLPKSTSHVIPTSFGKSLTMNPCSEVTTDMEENVWSNNPNGGATKLFGSDYPDFSSSLGVDLNAFAEGDGFRVSTHAVVEYYAKNNWAKRGLKRIMMNAKGFFFFKFDTWAGLDVVLEGGPWIIRNFPIILKKWSTKTSLQKDELTRIPIWVKLHDVPIQVFVEDGISLIATYLGKPIMLDSHTKSITIGIPDLDGLGFTKETIRVKAPKVSSNGDGTRSEVSSKAGSSKNTKEGASLTKKGTFTDRQKDKDVVDMGHMNMSNITTPNPFTVLGEDEDEEVCRRWKWTSNGSLCPKGLRIILRWNDDLVYVMIIAQTNQVMHVQVNTRADNKTLFCPFVYADIYYMDRHALWNNLVGHAGLMRNRPWVLMGDFNAALNLEGHSFGGYEPNVAIRDFKECVQAMKVSDPYRILDHSPCVLRIPTISKAKPKPFKFANFLMYKEGFHKVVELNLVGISKDIDGDPSSSILREEHAHYSLAFKEAQLDEERFLKQKAKVEWLKASDSNLGLKCVLQSIALKVPKAIAIVKSKCARNRIDIVSDSFNTLYEGNQVPDAFVNHYDQFLGTKCVTNHLDDHDLYTRVLDTAKSDFMVRDVTDIKGLGDIVSINQSTLAPGRRISDNILLTQELMRNYHRRRSPPRCVFKVDIQKAYDTADWKFLETILIGFGFHPKMVQWIMVCVSGASYSICVNGNLHGWFKGKRGLRQGEPLSPYLFTLVMEVLTLMLQRRMTCFYLLVVILVRFLLLWMRWRSSNREIKKGKAKVAWDSVCMPKHEGGIDVCLLKDMISNRDITRSGFSLDDSVSNLISDGVWRWPPDWLSSFPSMAQLQVPMLLDDMDDVILWRDKDGVLRSFSMACVWDTSRSRADVVQWYNFVWSPHCIPRHAIHMWLVVQQKLKTQDRLRQWNVWFKVRALCGMDSISPWLTDVMTFVVPISKGKTSILSRIVVATSSYYIWLEMNGRLFKKKTSSPDQIVQVILSIVRLKLVTFKFKKMSTRSRLLLD
nr:hypothetical protein [Tanacetum cinerariifolium]